MIESKAPSVMDEKMVTPIATKEPSLLGGPHCLSVTNPTATGDQFETEALGIKMLQMPTIVAALSFMSIRTDGGDPRRIVHRMHSS
jgi:hypothetical protein